eukprot:365580-Chlamydomonas_euryale.AAC.12
MGAMAACDQPQPQGLPDAQMPASAAALCTHPWAALHDADPTANLTARGSGKVGWKGYEDPVRVQGSQQRPRHTAACAVQAAASP